MAAKVYRWIGWGPRGYTAPGEEEWRRHQVSCVLLANSNAEVMRITGMARTEFKGYVNISEPDDSDRETLPFIFENPGVVFFRDTIRHIPREAPWVEHELPVKA